jgi:hypothetical protein
VPRPYVAELSRSTLLPPRIATEDFAYSKINWRPHDGQRKVINSRQRNRVLAAGRRFGKSEIGGTKLVQEAMNTRLALPMLDDLGKRREFWVIGPTYTDSEKEFRVLYNSLTKIGIGEYFDRPGTYNDPIGGNMHISLWGGKFQAHAKSAQHPESLVGEGLAGAVLAEAAKLKENVYPRFVRPMLADFHGWCLMTSTPEGKNWFYDLWRRGQDPKYVDWWSLRAPAWLNPYVYPGGASYELVDTYRELFLAGKPRDHIKIDPEIAALVEDLTDEAFDQEIGADFTTFVGRVFKEFDEEIHVTDLAYERGWPTYAAVDYGYTNPNVWLLIQEDPHTEIINVLGEVYMSGLAPDEFAEEILRRNLCPLDMIAFYPDPASPGDTAILERKLRVKHRGSAGSEVKFRIDAIRKWMRWRHPHLPHDHFENRPKLQFDRSCTKTILDMLNYRYAQKRSEMVGNPENPMKKDDHGPEALGRYFAGRHGTPDRVARRARQRRASVSG